MGLIHGVVNSKALSLSTLPPLLGRKGSFIIGAPDFFVQLALHLVDLFQIPGHKPVETDTDAAADYQQQNFVSHHTDGHAAGKHIVGRHNCVDGRCIVHPEGIAEQQEQQKHNAERPGRSAAEVIDRQAEQGHDAKSGKPPDEICLCGDMP